jgi:hypothetical protein
MPAKQEVNFTEDGRDETRHILVTQTGDKTCVFESTAPEGAKWTYKPKSSSFSPQAAVRAKRFY